MAEPVSAKLESLKAEPVTKLDNPGSIPLAQFLDRKVVADVQSVNPWFSRVQEWARCYRNIATDERDVRNYKLSEKFSEKALAWAHRSIQIKQLPTMGADTKVEFWLSQMRIPELPQTSSYFAAQDAYQKIAQTKLLLAETRNRSCLIKRGIPLIQSLAYLDLSIDLYKQKKYSKALYKIQIGMAPLENIETEEKKCDHPEMDDTEDSQTVN